MEAGHDLRHLPDVLRYEDVGEVLQLNARQVRRLKTATDALPVFYVSRKEPRVLKRAFLARLERRALAGASSRLYSPPDDWGRASAGTKTPRADAGADGGAARRDRQHGREMGAER